MLELTKSSASPIVVGLDNPKRQALPNVQAFSEFFNGSLAREQKSHIKSSELAGHPFTATASAPALAELDLSGLEKTAEASLELHLKPNVGGIKLTESPFLESDAYDVLKGGSDSATEEAVTLDVLVNKPVGKPENNEGGFIERSDPDLSVVLSDPKQIKLDTPLQVLSEGGSQALVETEINPEQLDDEVQLVTEFAQAQTQTVDGNTEHLETNAESPVSVSTLNFDPPQSHPSLNLQESESLGQAVVMPSEMVEKGLMTSRGEMLVDKTTELRQETRSIKLNAATAESGTLSGSSLTTKVASSEEASLPSRGQASQQQFMGMAQAVAQVTQGLREQQSERQFQSVLNERISTQVTSELEATKLASSTPTADRKTELPIGLQSIGLPVTHQKWGQSLGQRVVYMANQQIQQANITLNPEKLGPVQVRLQIDHEQKVNVVMTAQHGVTREALEAAMPRLREMLEQSGMTVGNVDVNDQKQFAEREHDPNKNEQASSGHTEFVDETQSDGMSAVLTHSTDNVVDYYA